METRLVAIIKGRRYYEVLKDTRALFTGTLAECRRFAKLHVEKELKASRERRRRNRPPAKVYRTWARPAAASGF